jgi:hypothetical protein
MKVETRDPFADVRHDPNVFIATLPRTRATFSYPPRTVLRMGWLLFWRALWSMVRRHRALDFWLEDDAR